MPGKFFAVRAPIFRNFHHTRHSWPPGPFDQHAIDQSTRIARRRQNRDRLFDRYETALSKRVIMRHRLSAFAVFLTVRLLVGLVLVVTLPFFGTILDGKRV
jgi:hypothetical protein